MARIDTPAHSDEEFDLLYDAESVSEMSDMEDGKEGASSDAQNTNTVRLTGPHEVPVIPHATRQDDIAAVTQELSDHSIRDAGDSSSTISPTLHRSSGSTRDRGNLMNDGLQYTKSMYKKLWNKDVLIAVMG